MREEEFIIVALLVIFPIIMTIIIVWVKSSESRKRYQWQSGFYAKALEKGVSLPPDFFVEPQKKRNPFNTGVICIAVGAGISLSVWLVQGSISGGGFSLGIIPFFIGVAYVIIHFIEKKKSTSEDAK